MKLISIIIPTYNRAKLLSQVISSYLCQFVPKEIIIIDDGSDAINKRILENLVGLSNTIKYIRHPRRLGLPRARNTGIDASKGDFVFFGEDDVWLEERHIEILISHLDRAGADIIAGRLINVESLDRRTLPHLCSRKADIIDLKYLTGDFSIEADDDIYVPFVHACSLAYKQIFRAIRFDPAFFNNTCFREETDFYLRAGARGFRVMFCPHAIAFHLKRSNSSPNNLGGCGSKKSLISKTQNQLNNILFAWKDKMILKRMGINPFIFVIKYWLRAFLSKVYIKKTS